MNIPLPTRLVLALSGMAMILLAGCKSSSSGKSIPPPPGFADKYYQGKAEVNSFSLTQARYGELREKGEAILIFVAEDFSPNTLTKHNGEGPKIPVLKMNFEKRFLTGIYPYNMFMTVAVPVDGGTDPRALKLSVSSQEWCGATYSQLNFKGGRYEMSEHSYFPNEGDQEGSLDPVLLEDEIWVRLRIHPENLPLGKIKVIPGGFQSRLRHIPWAVEEALASREEAPEFPGQECYMLEYPTSQRTLIIRYQKEWPFTIEGWTETYPDGFGENKPMLTTHAERFKSLDVDYWTKNHLGDSTLRKELGLQPH